MVRTFFWKEEGDGIPVSMSDFTSRRLQSYARENHVRELDVLRSVFDLFGEISEIHVLSFINMQTS